MSKSSQKKLTAVLAALSRAFDVHEAAQRSAPPARLFSPFHTAQPTLAFLLSTHHLVTQLVSLQSAATLPSPPAPAMSARLAAFTSWLKSAAPGCGVGETFAFQAGDGAEGNGVVALVALSPSSLVMSIPRSVMVTASCFSSASSALASPPAAAFAAFLSSLADPLLSNVPSLVLSLLLLYERQRVSPPSPLQPYLAVLPSHFSLPLFVPPAELRRLGRSPALLSVVNVQYNVLKQYVYLQQLLAKQRILAPSQSASPASPLTAFLSALPNGALSFSYDEFRWAVAVVMTRQNKIPAAASSSSSPSPSAAFELALIPGWDLANHRSSLSAINTFYSPASASSDTYSHPHELTAPGQAVHLFYGHRSSRELFVYSGFIEADSERREYEMMLTPDDEREDEVATAAGGWGKIREVMRKKAGLDAGGALTLPLPLTEEEWEAELQRRRQREQQQEASRQAAWQQYTAAGGGLSPSSSPPLPASASSPSSLPSAEDNERRLASLLSFLRIAAVSSKQEAMDALRLQTMRQQMPRVSPEHERRALQLLMTALQREENAQGGHKAADEELRTMRMARQSAGGDGSVEEQRTELMLRMRLEGLQLLREAQDTVRGWQRRLDAEESQPAAAHEPQVVSLS